MKFKDTIKKRVFEITFRIEVESETLKEGLAKAKDSVKKMGIKAEDVKPAKSKRTDQQNKSIHLYLEQWAQLFRENGIDMREVVKTDISMPPTMIAMKEYVWRPVQRSLFGKKSTTQLDKTSEINQIVDVMTKAFGERFGLYVPFPSMENEAVDNS